MRRRELIHGALVAPMLTHRWAHAQGAAAQLPSTIRYVVPFAAGGLTDVMARMAAKHLAEVLGASVVVENRTGGNAQIGAEHVAKGPADGSQLLAITLAHAANVTLLPGANYDFRKDLQPLVMLAGVPMLVVVPTNSPIMSLADLMQAAKDKTLNVGSSGNGTPPHLAMALFSQTNRSRFNHIPYRGGAPSMTDLIAGRLDVIFSNFPESIPHVMAGRLRALALCSSTRHPQLPDVPTTAEAGMPGLLVENWTAAMVRSGTSPALIDRYSRELVKFMFTPEVEERAKTMGFLPKPMGAQAFGDFLNREIERWGGLIRAANIQVT